MITKALDDPEGDLVEALRQALGPQIPLAISLDLHAHITARMLAAADIIVACKTNPHSDYDLAGERAAELLLSTLDGKIHPVTAAVWIPLIVGARMETERGPLLELHRLRRALGERHAEVLDISIYNTTTLVDAVGAGQCITVITDGNLDLAGRLASELAMDLWSRREAFTSDFTPLGKALATAAAHGTQGPLVLGDQGDRVLAGTPGDGTLIISELLGNWPRLRAVVPLTDPLTVAAAARLGIGKILAGPIGGRLSEDAASVEGEWHILGLGEGRFVQQGPFLMGEPAELGKTSILRFANVTVLVTSLPGYTQDVEAFRSQGIDLREYDVIVTKSGYHFKLSFGEIGRCIVVDTPGISNYRPGLLPYRRRRPVFPEDRLGEPSFEPIVFSPRCFTARPQMRKPPADLREQALRSSRE